MKLTDIQEATVKTSKYSWGTMKTIHHGSSFSIPLHPEHHQPISKLKDGDSHSFKDETGTSWNATREGDNVHFKSVGSKSGMKTTVPHKSLVEERTKMKLTDIKESRIIKGKSYGATYDAGEDDNKKTTPTGEKRGRGRPAKETQPFASSSSASKSLQDILVGKVSKKLSTKGRVFKMKEDVERLASKGAKSSELEEMAMGSKKNTSGKKVEWTNHPGLGHSVTVDGDPVHKGFVDHKTAASLYAKHSAA